MVVLCSRCKKKFDVLREQMWQIEFFPWNYPIGPDSFAYDQDDILKSVVLCNHCKKELENELLEEGKNE